ncbi:MAG: flippase-like domain-containing protein [Chloroflexota bacterium]|nr:flippase-like domain-containing protein [Chloroflexota bacterium]
MGKRGRLIGGVALTALFLWLALRNVDIGAVRDGLRHARYEFLLPAALCNVAGYGVRTLRWQRILAPTKRVSFGRLYPVLMTGFAANNLLPARIGEFTRAYLLGSRERVSRSLALATIVVERVCDGLTLLALMAVTLALVPIPATDAHLRTVEIAAALIFGLATAGLVALMLVPRPLLAIVRLLLRPAPRALARRVAGLLESFIGGLEALRRPRALASIAGLSLVVWALEGASYGFIMLAFPFDLGPGQWFAAAAFLLVFVNLGIMIPSAPGYIGTYQVFARLALGAFGVAPALAVGLSFVAHALQYGLITGTGLLCCWRLGLTPARLGTLARTTQPRGGGARPLAAGAEVAD